MALKLTIEDVLSKEMVEAKQDHIRDFLLQEGITADAADLSRTELTERQLKELLAELADDVSG